MKNKLTLIDIDGTANSLHLNGNVILASDRPDSLKVVQDATVALQDALSLNAVFIRIEGSQYGLAPAEIMAHLESVSPERSQLNFDVGQLEWHEYSGDERQNMFALKHTDGQLVRNIGFRLIEEGRTIVGAVIQHSLEAKDTFNLACHAPRLAGALYQLFALARKGLDHSQTTIELSADLDEYIKLYADVQRIAAESHDIASSLTWRISKAVPRYFLEEPGNHQFAHYEICNGDEVVAVIQSQTDLMAHALLLKAQLIANAPLMLNHIWNLQAKLSAYVGEEEHSEESLSGYIVTYQEEIEGVLTQGL